MPDALAQLVPVLPYNDKKIINRTQWCFALMALNFYAIFAMIRAGGFMNIERIDNKRTVVFIDASNFHYALRKHGWEIDYKKFKDWLGKYYNIIDIYFYTGIHSDKSFFDSNQKYKSHEPSVRRLLLNEYQEKIKGFFKFLRQNGYKVYEKPISSIYDNTSGEYKLKCNCDVELTMDVLFRINDYDRIILCSGDGDFVRLIKYAKYMHKHTVIIASADRTSSLLKKHANQTIKLGEIRKDIELIRPPKAENPTG